MIMFDMYRLGFQAIMEGEYTLGLLAIAIITGVWLFLLWVLKSTIWNTVFPEVRIVDGMKNKVTIARRYWPIRGEDKDYIVKFSLFPIFQFYTLRVGKQEADRWPPWAINLRGKDIEWNSDEEVWQIVDRHGDVVTESLKSYETHVRHLLHRVASDVAQGVKGDQGLQKRKYRLGVPNPMEDMENLEEEEKKMDEELEEIYGETEEDTN